MNYSMSLYRTKYNSTRTRTRDGHSFASKLEAAVWEILKAKQEAGEISDLRCQHHVSLTLADVKMIPDFSAINTKTGERWFFEAKGAETPEWRIKRRLWAGGYGPGPLEVWSGSYKYPSLKETIYPKTRADKPT